MRISPMEQNAIRRCAAIQCDNNATAWVETIWTAARRVSSLNGSRVARFTKKYAACDAHAEMAQRRVEMLNR